VKGKSTNESNGNHAILKMLVVESNEQRSHVLSLGKMFIKPFMKRRQNRPSNFMLCIDGIECISFRFVSKQTWIGDPDCEQLV
jgi:hypothetical protein